MTSAAVDNLIADRSMEITPSMDKHAHHAVLHRCRLCDAELSHVFVDLGTSPLCESYLSADQLDQPESFYPLAVYVCEKCLLVQLPAHASGEQIFSEYAYFSSFSESYLEHARRNAEALIERFGLNSQSFVVEVACNDGYLLRNFVARNIPCLGIEPAGNVARTAQAAGIPVVNKFFGEQTARELLAQEKLAQRKKTDLLVANNVLAHVPDLHDFVRGIKLLLAADGVAVIEVQHLLRLIERNQFDTIYHEHFCYYTLKTLISVFAAHEMTVFDVEEIPTHGGSLRVFAKHADDKARLQTSDRVAQLIQIERAAGLYALAGYGGFAEKVSNVKHGLVEFLIEAKRNGRKVAGYGAPGKGNTLLNYCGTGRELLDYTVDRNPYKQGKFLPGTRIPIYPPERIAETRPDYVLILPWNLREEISAQLEYIRSWGGKFVVPIPRLEIWQRMVILEQALTQREAEGRPIRIGLVGAGFMGRGLALQLCTPLVGMRLAAIANRNLDGAQRAWAEAGAGQAVIARKQSEVDSALAADQPLVVDNPALLCHAEGIDALIECTGNVESSVRTALEAIASRKHIVLMNAELDATLGPILKARADQAGVVISNADGDEPALAMDLLRYVRSIGYRPVMAGNLKGFLDRYRTPETQRGFAEQTHQDPVKCAAYADGTKLNMEACVLANASGMKVGRRGMFGPKCEHVSGAAEQMVKHVSADQLLAQPLVDYVLGAQPGAGVFVVGYNDEPKKQHYMNYLKMGSGPLYVFYRPHVLPHLEAPLTAARAVLFGAAPIAPLGAPVCDVVAIVKRDLKAGEILDGLGGFTCYGLIENADTARDQNLLPMGLSEGCRLLRDIRRDEAISYADVEIPANRLSDRLRTEQNQFFSDATNKPKTVINNEHLVVETHPHRPLVTSL